MTAESLYLSDTEKTFQYQSELPSLPVPTLQHTLQRYLESTRPHLTDEEYSTTEALVNEFGNGVGKQLQQGLLDRAKYKRNWLEDWWQTLAYLDTRLPSAPLVNFSGPSPYRDHSWPAQAGSQCKRAGILMHFTLMFWKYLREEKIKPDKDQRNTRFCMAQYHRAFNTCKIPGQKTDRFEFCFKTEQEGDCPRHMIVFCRGRIFSFDVADENYKLLTAPELQMQFERIRAKCDGQPAGPGLGALTADHRTTWAKMRNYLIALHPDNFHYLKLIQESISATALEDDDLPEDDTMIYNIGMCGDPQNRWFDKSTTAVITRNGLVSSNCDHAPYEAMVFVYNTFFLDLKIRECKGKWLGSNEIRDLPEPTELKFYVNDIVLEAIQNARQVYFANTNNLNSIVWRFNKFGKRFLKEVRFHPDNFVQMAIQYAYYRIYKRPVPTYETATTRQFYHGRTETMRSCTTEVIEWCRAMMDDSVSVETRLQLLKRASEKHTKLMGEAMENRGCDRHLLGLFQTSVEEGIPTPGIFTDPAFTKSGGGGNFLMSTSCAGYTTIMGGVAPMCEGGYGCFYTINDDRISAVVCNWKNDKDTDAQMLIDSLNHCLVEMRNMIDTRNTSQARL